MEGVTFKHKFVYKLTAFLLSIQTMFQRNQVTISRGITLLLLVCSAWLLGKMVWLPFTPNSIVPWRAQISELNESPISRVGVESIKRHNLFGQFVKNAKPKVVTPSIKEAPKTSLSLNLVGVVVVEPSELSLAIIANKNNQDTYGIDQKIEGTRATLSAVYSDRVVLDNAGRSETLLLTEKSDSRISRVNSERTRRENKPAVDYSADAPSQANEDKLAELKEKIAEKPSRLLQYIRMSKLKRDGSVVGYRLRPKGSPDLFESLGFLNGDIVTQINGIDLSEDGALSHLTASLDDIGELSIIVERDGQPYDIYIQL
ncbi:type II secretion system protein GspC [Vibrio sp. RC27]